MSEAKRVRMMDDNYCGSCGGGGGCAEVRAGAVFVASVRVYSSLLHSSSNLTSGEILQAEQISLFQLVVSHCLICFAIHRSLRSHLVRADLEPKPLESSKVQRCSRKQSRMVRLPKTSQEEKQEVGWVVRRRGGGGF